MKQEQFLNVVDRDEAHRRFRDALAHLPNLGGEQLPLREALGRVLAEDIQSAVNVPGFDRSNMDGYAVRAADTYGATEQQPRQLTASTDSVRIGTLPQSPLRAGYAMPIPTGGALPRGADAVVMVEATERLDDRVEIRKAVTPGTAVSFAGTDIAQGETLLRNGEVLSSRETGVLAAIGRDQVLVRRLPRVAILSTGDELVEPGKVAASGQVYDCNAVLLRDAVRECGGLPISLGIAPDDESELSGVLSRAIEEHDLVLISGGTSKGPGDLNVRALSNVLQAPGILVHGVALKPGKPICLAVSGNTPVVILPGFPTSAIFTFHEFVAPLLRDRAGLSSKSPKVLHATLPFRFTSDPGRTEYCLTHLVSDEKGDTLAYPIRKGSGAITTWSHADGYFVVPQHVEHVAANSTIAVHAMAGVGPRQVDLVVIGSHCVGLDILLTELKAEGFSSKLIAVGSEGGLSAAQRGACDIAGIHLFDPRTGEYNRSFIDEGLELFDGYGRMQGVVFRAGDPRFEGLAAEVAVREAAHNDDITMINRNRGSGTRVLYDRLVGEARPAGFDVQASSHHAVAAAVEQGRADFGIAIEVVARDRKLGFLPIAEERFDFILPKGRRQRPAVKTFCRLLGTDKVRAKLNERGFIA